MDAATYTRMAELPTNWYAVTCAQHLHTTRCMSWPPCGVAHHAMPTFLPTSASQQMHVQACMDSSCPKQYRCSRAIVRHHPAVSVVIKLMQQQPPRSLPPATAGHHTTGPCEGSTPQQGLQAQRKPLIVHISNRYRRSHTPPHMLAPLQAASKRANVRQECRLFVLKDCRHTLDNSARCQHPMHHPSLQTSTPPHCPA